MWELKLGSYFSPHRSRQIDRTFICTSEPQDAAVKAKVEAVAHTPSTKIQPCDDTSVENFVPTIDYTVNPLEPRVQKIKSTNLTLN